VNNREIASLVWLAVALAAALFSRDIRSAFWAVAKSFVHLKIVGPILLLAAWVAGLVAVAHGLGLWEATERNDTIVWFVTVGIAFYFSLDKTKQEHFFRTTALHAVAATVFVEGFVNLAVFGLAVELLIAPVVAFLVMLRAVAEQKPGHAQVGRLVSGLLSIVGVVFLAYSAEQFVTSPDLAHAARVLVLPVWLTAGVMPLIYVIGLGSEYEVAFMRIDHHTDDRTNRRRAKRALLHAANVRASELAGFAGHWIWDLASAESDHEARTIMRRWRETWRDEERASCLANARSSLEDWLTQPDPALADIHADMLRRGWERLDIAQRAALKAEGLRLAGTGPAREGVRALPD
jgi:hypothetical protein